MKLAKDIGEVLPFSLREEVTQLGFDMAEMRAAMREEGSAKGLWNRSEEIKKREREFFATSAAFRDANQSIYDRWRQPSIFARDYTGERAALNRKIDLGH